MSSHPRTALRPDWQQHRSSDGVTLHHTIIGPPGAPLVVLCNGIGASALAWRWIVNLSGYRFLVWHYRGTLSGSAPADLSLERHADDVLELIDEVGEPVHAVIGWSMGVGVACWVAAKLDQNPGLIFLSGCEKDPQRKILGTRIGWWVLKPGLKLSVHLPPSVNHLSGRLLRRVARSRRVRSAFIESFVRLGCLDEVIDREHFSSLLGEWFQADLQVISRQLLAVCEDGGPGEDTLRGLSNPVLVVAGERDPMVHASLSKSFAQLFQHAELFVHPQSTHFMIFEYPEELKTVLCRFLSAASEAAQSPA